MINVPLAMCTKFPEAGAGVDGGGGETTLVEVGAASPASSAASLDIRS
jgi:hypothetical protein